MSKTPPAQIAVVDDEATVRKALARLLTASSFEPKLYASAREFIAAIEDNLPTCLVLDVHMPEFTGVDLLRYLQAQQKIIPTVVITAHDDKATRERCAALGATEFLVKPLNSDKLLESIKSATKKAGVD